MEVQSSIGYTHVMLGELALAGRYTTQVLHKQRQVRDRLGEKLALIILAGLHTQQAHYPAALAAYDQVARLAPTPTDSLTMASGRVDIYAAQGQYALASAQARRGLALARRLSKLDIQAVLEAPLADGYLQQGQVDSARCYAHRQRRGSYLFTACTCGVLAQAYAARGNFA